MSAMTVLPITVLMPVYNAAPFVQCAIDSILSQSYGGFEFLIIDDGSTDDSWQILELAARQDRRIRLLRHETNLGLVPTLNRGLALAQGEYVARMDADDESADGRLAQQLAFLQANPQVGVCGAWARTFGQRAQAMRYPTDDAGIRAALLFHSPFAHPSVMMRRQPLVDFNLTYDERRRHVEDYAFWLCWADHTQFANLPAYLLRYRLHPKQTGQCHSAEQHAGRRRIWYSQLLALEIDAGEAELGLHEIAAGVRTVRNPAQLAAVEQWLLHLAAANRRVKRYPQRAFAALLTEKWLRLGLAAPGRTLANVGWVVASPLMRGADLRAWAHYFWQRARS